jgi:hypothetical protein
VALHQGPQPLDARATRAPKSPTLPTLTLTTSTASLNKTFATTVRFTAACQIKHLNPARIPPSRSTRPGQPVRLPLSTLPLELAHTECCSDFRPTGCMQFGGLSDLSDKAGCGIVIIGQRARCGGGPHALATWTACFTFALDTPHYCRIENS